MSAWGGLTCALLAPRQSCEREFRKKEKISLYRTEEWGVSEGGDIFTGDGAHVVGTRGDADSPDVEPVGIPAGADRRVGGGMAGRVIAHSLLEQFEPVPVEGEDGRHDPVEHLRRPWAVKKVVAVVQSAGVVQQGEKAHHRQVGTTAFGDAQAEGLDPLPVAWPVDGVRTAPENRHHVVADPGKPDLGRAFHIRNSLDDLSHLHLLPAGAHDTDLGRPIANGPLRSGYGRIGSPEG